MAFFLPFEAEAIGLAVGEAFAGIATGIAGAFVAGHHDGVDKTDDNLDTGGIADDDDVPDSTGGGTENEKHPFYVTWSESMEISRANEVGFDPYRVERINRIKSRWHHLRKFAWEYGATAAAAVALGVYRYNRRYRQSLSRQEAEHERRLIRHYQLRHYAPHRAAPDSPFGTPQSTRRKRARQEALWDGLRVRVYR